MAEIMPVAPHWGAWIEILQITAITGRVWVAPHWGAWIEIVARHGSGICTPSHPTGVRGLKYARLREAFVAFRSSHPTGVRGLKSEH